MAMWGVVLGNSFPSDVLCSRCSASLGPRSVFKEEQALTCVRLGECGWTHGGDFPWALKLWFMHMKEGGGEKAQDCNGQAKTSLCGCDATRSPSLGVVSAGLEDLSPWQMPSPKGLNQNGYPKGGKNRK